MTKEVRKPNYLEIGYKTYFYLDEICEYLEIEMDDAYYVLVNNGLNDWHITSTGEILTNSMCYRSLMILVDKDKYSTLIEEMNFICEEEKIWEERMELNAKKHKIDKSLKKLSEQLDENARKWDEFRK
jgi:hypothetical protein